MTDLASYPFVIPVTVRWRDLDAFRHVNNAVVVSYLEMARAAMWRDHFDCADPMGIPFVIAHLEIDYKRPIELFDEVRVGMRTADVSASSFAFDYLVTAGDRVAAVARTVQVCVRYETGRPVRVPEDLRRSLAALTGGAS